MKINQSTGIVLILLCLFCNPKNIEGQVIESKVNFHLDYLSGQFAGKKESGENGFIYPGFYANLKRMNGYSAKATYKIFPVLNIGLEGGKVNGSNWSYHESELYQEADVNLKSFAPVLQFHTKFKETGIQNRLKSYIEIAPVFGQATLNLEHSVFEVVLSDGNKKQLTEIINNFMGVKMGAGIEYTFSKDAGIQLSYSFQQNSITSAFYTDEQFLQRQISLGIYLRFLKDKRYAYYE